MVRLRVTAMLLVLSWCVTTLSPQGPTTPGHMPPYLVSLIRVIANPNDFNGQRIRVVGFLGPGGGLDRSVGLYVSETDGRSHIVPNSIDLHVEGSRVKDLMGRYVLLSGTYHAPAPRASYNGYIDQVLEVGPWP